VKLFFSNFQLAKSLDYLIIRAFFDLNLVKINFVNNTMPTFSRYFYPLGRID